MKRTNNEHTKGTNFMGKKKDYPDRQIEDEISYKIKTLDTTRQNRITLSKRLSRYSRRWRFIFFIINIEAVIFVLLSLTNTINVIPLGDWKIPFNLVSGIFTIYVILLQYYINILNYNERALQVHYHQLEIEDLILQLKMLFIRQNSANEDISQTDLIKQHDQIIAKYQLALKNNENHRNIDHRKNKYQRELKKYNALNKHFAAYGPNNQQKVQDDSKGNSKNHSNEQSPFQTENNSTKQLVKKPNFIHQLDNSLDNFLIYANGLLTFFMLLVILYVVIFHTKGMV